MFLYLCLEVLFAHLLKECGGTPCLLILLNYHPLSLLLLLLLLLGLDLNLQLWQLGLTGCRV
jgi:hypothetical protein